MANARTIDRQSWWMAFDQWMTDKGASDPICEECAEPMELAAFTGRFLCDECEAAEQERA